MKRYLALLVLIVMAVSVGAACVVNADQTTNDKPLAAPRQESPRDGAIVQRAGEPPTFTWSPVSGANYYVFVTDFKDPQTGMWIGAGWDGYQYQVGDKTSFTYTKAVWAGKEKTVHRWWVIAYNTRTGERSGLKDYSHITIQ